MWGQALGWEDPLDEEMATDSSNLAWKVPQTEEPGGLQSMRSQRIRHDWATEHSIAHTCKGGSHPRKYGQCSQDSEFSGEAVPWLFFVRLFHFYFLFNFYFLRFFWCGPFLKSLLNLLQYCFWFMFWFFWPQGMWCLSSLTWDQTCTPCIGRWNLNHWTTGEVPVWLF